MVVLACVLVDFTQKLVPTHKNRNSGHIIFTFIVDIKVNICLLFVTSSYGFV